MVAARQPAAGEITTLLGRGASFEGKLTFEGTVRIDGRFKGGHITRHYGQPAAHVHALQVELAQCAYMDEAAGGYDVARAAPLQGLLRAVIEALLRWQPGAA